jgi:excinuclease UvrABC ATPase subunit
MAQAPASVTAELIHRKNKSPGPADQLPSGRSALGGPRRRTVEPVIQTLAVENYRSLRRLLIPLAALNVVTDANGSGKSSLYRVCLVSMTTGIVRPVPAS